MDREISDLATAEIRRMAEQDVSLNIGSVCCDALHRLVVRMERDSECRVPLGPGLNNHIVWKPPGGLLDP